LVKVVASKPYRYDSPELAAASIAELSAAGNTRAYHVEALPAGRRRY